MHFKMILAFVEDEKTDAIMDAARETGATGATVINNARGEGLAKSKTFFGQPYEPYLSEHAAVVSIQPTSAVHFLTSFASYFLVHLFFLGKLRTLPLYELNQQELIAKNKTAWSSACATQALYNTMLVVDAVPSRVMREFGLNFDLWFPVHRRLIDLVKLKWNGRRYAEHCKKSLDRVRERYGVQCGVLTNGHAQSGAP